MLTFQALEKIIALLTEIRDLLKENASSTSYTRCGCGHTWVTGQKHDCLKDCCVLAA